MKLNPHSRIRATRLQRFAALCCLLCWPLLLSAGETTATAEKTIAPKPVDIVLTVDTDNKNWNVTMTFPDPPAKEALVRIPVWIPGAYWFMGFSRTITEFKAENEKGEPLSFTEPVPVPKEKRVSKYNLNDSTWRVQTGEAKAITVRYKVAKTKRMFVRGTQFTGPDIYMYVDGQVRRPHRVRFDLPKDWRVATGLTPTKDPLTFTAAHYDDLVDCPVWAGSDWWQVTGQTHGVTIHLCFNGLDAVHKEDVKKRFLPNLLKICEYQFALFDDTPFTDYWFLFNVRNRGGSGLEHKNSTQINISKNTVIKGFGREFGTIAHEFFHLWNVKRIRANPIKPFDYTQLPKIDCLWFHEGCTSYYDDITLVRTGLLSEERFLRILAIHVSRAHSGTGLSYYSWGEAYGFLLDLKMRLATGNRVGLDDLFRSMYEKYGKRDFGKTFNQSRGIFEEIKRLTDTDMSDFLENQVLSKPRKPFDIAALAEQAGLSYAVVEEGKQAILGIRPSMKAGKNGGVVISQVLKGGAQKAGLKAGDEITRLDKHDYNLKNYRSVAKALKGDVTVDVEYHRDGKLQKGRIELGARILNKAVFKIKPERTELQQAILESILKGDPKREKTVRERRSARLGIEVAPPQDPPPWKPEKAPSTTVAKQAENKTPMKKSESTNQPASGTNPAAPSTRPAHTPK